MKVRCVSKNRQEVDQKRRIIRDSLLQSPPSDVWRQATPRLRDRTTTIEIEESCRNLRLPIQHGSDSSDVPVYHPYLDENHADFEDPWLSRKNSGWHWLLQDIQPSQ